MSNATVPANGEAMPTIPAIFARWTAAQAQLDASRTDDEAGAAVDAQKALKPLIAPLMPATASEFAMKLLIDTNNGQFQHDEALIEQARTLATLGTLPNDDAVLSAFTRLVETDRVVSLARDMGKATSEYDRLCHLAAKHQKTTAGYLYAEGMEEAGDRRAAIEASMSQHKATSAEGAAVQACLLIDALIRIAETAGDSDQQDQFAQDMRAANRLAFSVIDYLRSASAFKPEAFGFEYQHLNPWLSADERLSHTGIALEEVR